MKKYDISTLLLYVSHQLPKELMQEISDYFVVNPEELQHLISIIKINTHLKSVQDKIEFNYIKETIQQHCSGIVSLLQEKQLAFRSAVKSYQYEFLDFTLDFIWMSDDNCNLCINSNEKSLYCEVLSKDFNFLFRKEIMKSEMISLKASNIYYLHVPSYVQNSIVEISL